MKGYFIHTISLAPVLSLAHVGHCRGLCGSGVRVGRLRKVMCNVFLAMASVALLAFTSCGREADVADNLDGETRMSLGFYMANRAPADDHYESGSYDENYIKDCKFFFFDSDNKFMAEFKPDEMFPEPLEGGGRYKVSGLVPDAVIRCTTFKFVVLANWPDYGDGVMVPGETSIDDICNGDWGQFDCVDGFMPSHESGNVIPFFGVHEYEDVNFKPGGELGLEEPVTLLRAMAKVEVILDTHDESGDYLSDASFSEVSICRYNAKGYCAPENVYSQYDYGQGNDWATDYLPSLHLVGGENDPENAPGTDERRLGFTCVNRRGDTDNEKWTVYVPEYCNQSGDDYSYIEVRLASQTGESAPYKIYFSDYEDGKLKDEPRFFNIERNNLYRFTVRVRNGKIEVNVQKWYNAYDNDYTFE